ncbi:MAG: bifunctional phosphoribosylaminoimidazolecarboxamide formyltransferase/IMP cyclohydrolase [Gemmataceae bacterium]|nr:bifunctional phosphoribosylaminoimidazolecarboxamide formyltransferase/IMP cyclohydrolase [Gemmataceae bacterium]
MLRPVRRALISVSDKTGLLDLARSLVAAGVELVSTGGTHKTLADAGIAVREVSAVTGFPEMLDGRVKTLHPKLHGGILFRRDDPAHVEATKTHGIDPIDLVIVNLYPFESTVAKPDVSWEHAVENIDIGGPSLIRGAAKNHEDVAVIVDPSQYAGLLAELQNNWGSTTLKYRQRLAAQAYARTAAYDAAIASYFASVGHADALDDRLTLTFRRKQSLRYGENPHQQAGFYSEVTPPACSIASANQRHGKELSYNNILDLDAAWNLVCEFDGPAAVVVKHNNPCGAAVADSLAAAFADAYSGDPLSAFGGILAFNRPVNAATAALIAEPNRFVEAIIAPAFEPEAFEIITTRPSWKKNVRLLETGGVPTARSGFDLRRVAGGLLVQGWDAGADDPTKWKVCSTRDPSPAELAALEFAWTVCKAVKSNAIVLAQGTKVVGVGAGQMSRVDSVEIACRKAGDRAKGAVMASDAFFPFRDNIDAAARVGVSAIVQPGGSLRDGDSITACNEHGIAMLMTGVRHFRH